MYTCAVFVEFKPGVTNNCSQLEIMFFRTVRWTTFHLHSLPFHILPSPFTHSLQSLFSSAAPTKTTIWGFTASQISLSINKFRGDEIINVHQNPSYSSCLMIYVAFFWQLFYDSLLFFPIFVLNLLPLVMLGYCWMLHGLRWTIEVLRVYCRFPFR